MRAWSVVRHADPLAALELRSVDPPDPGPGEVRVRVYATSCNFADTLLCRGQYQVRPPLPFTPGLETCGVVDAVGDGVPPSLLGRRVVGQPVLPFGGFAEWTVMRADHVFDVPDSVDSPMAATLHLTYLTAWLGLHRRAGLQPDDLVVVTSVAGGVGAAAAQLAKAAGARVIGIASGAAKCASAREAGVDIVLDRNDGDIVNRVRADCIRGSADVVFESLGGESYLEATRYVGFEGRIVVVGFASGTIPEAKLNHAMVKNYSIEGLHWSLYLAHNHDLVRRAQQEVFQLLADQRIRPPEPRQISVDEVAAALNELAGRSTQGKTVMVV
jgi:NADPH2:quinone reductase